MEKQMVRAACMTVDSVLHTRQFVSATSRQAKAVLSSDRAPMCECLNVISACGDSWSPYNNRR